MPLVLTRNTLVLLAIVIASVAYSFKPGLWAGVGIGYDYGGESEVNGDNKDNRQQNEGWGATISYPLNKRTGVSLFYFETRTQESTGLDSEGLTVSLSFSL